MTEEEFKETIWPLKDRMLHLAFAILQRRELAEDVVQNIFERFWSRPLLHFRVLNPEAFVMRSVRNACYDELRRRRDFNMDKLPETEDSSCNSLGDDGRMVLRAISSLPDKERTVVTLKDVDGYDTREIARMLRMSEGNVRAVLSRARRGLRAEIEKMI